MGLKASRGARDHDGTGGSLAAPSVSSCLAVIAPAITPGPEPVFGWRGIARSSKPTSRLLGRPARPRRQVRKITSHTPGVAEIPRPGVGGHQLQALEVRESRRGLPESPRTRS